jgi:hypothetical protein
MKKINSLLNIVIVLSLAVTCFSFVMCIASGGILNDLDMALIEIQEIENKGLLDNPPAKTSSIALREIKLVGNSLGLKEYIRENEEHLSVLEMIFYLAGMILILLIFIRIFIGKKFGSRK